MRIRLCALALAVSTTIHAQDVKTVLANTAKAMGVANLTTIQFSGMGSNAGIGQGLNPKAGWPVTRVKSYLREIDLGATASHVQMVRVQGKADETQNQFISASSPWDTQYGFWITPFGFLKGAMANNAKLTTETIDGVKYKAVTCTLQNKYKVTGYINDQNMVEKVRTWIDNDVLGDMAVEGWYTVYKDYGGVKFPTMIVEKQGGFPTLILAVSDVKPNVAVNIQPPPQPVAPAPAVTVQSEKVADGVYYLKGGTHHSVAIEFDDYVVVVEAPLNEQRSLAVIAEVKTLIPNKPIRYLVNTHQHFDHSGGLSAYVDEGATIVTQEMNKQFYEQAFSAPRTLNPDRLAQSRKAAKIETVGDKKVLTVGTRNLELHWIKNSPHNDGILLAFLPKEKILIEADVYTPPAANAPAPAQGPAVNTSTVNLVDNAERLKLDFETILPLHGPGAATRADLYAAIHKPMPSISAILATPAGRGGAQAAPVPVPAGAPSNDPGRKILDNACAGCHTLSRVTSKNLPQADWQLIVDKMKNRGADVSDEDTAALVAYLVKTYGPK
jgi:glyoxylase-like metal-dependent hydrolase (beta-lactamase superfamily II)